MAEYTPPPCNAIPFVVYETINILPCNELIYDIASKETPIRCKTSIINLYDSGIVCIEAVMVDFTSTILPVYGNDCGLEKVITIQPDNSKFSMMDSGCIFHMLPDCIIEPTIFSICAADNSITPGGESDLPTGVSIGAIKVNWEKTTFIHETVSNNWEEGTPVDEFTEFLAGDGDYMSAPSIDADWNVMTTVDELSDIHLCKPLVIIDYYTSHLWKQFLTVDEFDKICWDSFFYRDWIYDVKWRAPGPKDIEKKMSWDTLNPLSDSLVVNWRQPGPKDKRMIVPWGPVEYFAYCQTHYYPPDNGVVNFKSEPFDSKLAGICMSIVFDVEGLNSDPRCPYDHKKSGSRDPYNHGIDVDIYYPYYPPEKEQYYMLNTVLVKRLPDNIPIEVTSISIKYDKQSWLWSFSLTIGKDKHEYLDLIKPNPLNSNIFTDIEIYINGWKWICRVESWDESRVFAKDSWRISGRSPSMELGYPQNVKTSYIYNPSNGASSTAGGQIIDDILEGTMLGVPDTGWSIDWDAYIGTNEIHTGFDPNDASFWGIKDGSFSWTDKTQIEVIKSLTESIGAFIITNPYCTGTGKKLIIRPKYDQPPWYWNTANQYRPVIDHYINTSYAPEVGRNYSQLATYNSVYVMGQHSTEAQKTNTTEGIVVVEVYRDGVGPGNRVYSEDIVNPYLYNWQAALELGRMTLCETGEWLNHKLRLFSLAEYTDATPKISRLILPGDFVQVSEKNTTWCGMASSTEVTANVVNGSAFAVYQNIEVQQYIGN